MKNWCFGVAVLEKTLESPLDCKEIKPVNPKGNQPWIFTGRTNAEAEALILLPPDVKSQLIGKDPDTGNNWSQEEKQLAEAEMVRQHHPSMDMNLSKLWEIVENRGAQCATVHEVAKNQAWLNDCTMTRSTMQIFLDLQWGYIQIL